METPPSSQEPAARFGDDLPDRALSLIDLVVDTINDRIVRPVVLVGRSIVFGLVMAAVAIVVAGVVAVASLRVLDAYAFAHHVWASYSVLGAAFCAVGLAFWSRRTARDRG